MNTNDPYLAYYRHQQLGHGVSSVYQGAAYQRGHGVGSFLGGLFRTISPLLKSGARTLGREALRTGVGFLGDIAEGTVRPRHAAGARFKEFTNTLKRKADSKMDRVLSGGGAAVASYKKRRIARVTPQSLNRLLRASTKKRTSVKKRTSAKKKKKQRKTTRRRTAGGKRKARAVRKQRKNRRKVVHRRRKRRGASGVGDIFN